MSSHLKDRLEKIQQLIDKLTEESAKGKPVVVEGKKDEQALRELGVNGKIVTVKTGGKSFLAATMEIEALSPTEVILFLDFDRRGKEGTKWLMQNLERAKIKVTVNLWRSLYGLVGHDLQCIESLPSYLNILQKKVNL